MQRIPSQPRHSAPLPSRPTPKRHFARGVLIAVAVLLGINAALFVFYRNHTYPRTALGNIAVGNTSFGHAVATASLPNNLPTSVTLAHGTQRVAISSHDLGITPDSQRATASLAAGRSWVPLVAIFTRHQLAAPLKVDNAMAMAEATHLATVFHVDPVDAKITLVGTTFAAVPASNGYDLDKTKLAAAVLAALDHGQNTVPAPSVAVAPHTTTLQAQATARKLQADLATPISYVYKGTARQIADSDKVKWYVPSGNSYEVDDFALRSFIATTGVAMDVHAQNLSAAVAATKQALQTHAALSFSLEPFTTTKTYQYCVASRGVDLSNVDDLKAKLVATYADLRGWSLDGQVLFTYATSNCDFTVWLSASNQMSSFGAICDSYWNCEVNNNVVVNFDRWTGTSDSWKAYGGSVDDYRTMLINHETGHMLGFGHDTCPGPGQPAPVMMQESIDLQGCVFNIWPVPKELGVLRQRLGL